jgi:hypothetical protein
MTFRRMLPVAISLLGLGTMAGGCAVPVAVTAGSYAADGALLATTDKTSTDHLASVVTKKDCATMRVVRGGQMCKEREGGHDPYDTNYDEPFRSPGEDGGVQYGPPLHAAANAPAASWDAAAYKAVPAEPSPPTAAADAAPAAPTPVATAPSPKVRKTKSRSAKKPSQGRAATAP